MGVKLAIHKEDIIAFVLCSLDIGVLRLSIRGIEKDKLLVLVGLLSLNGFPVVIDAEVFALRILEQAEFHGPFAELLVAQHPVFNEELEIVPLLFKGLTLILEDFLKTVSDLSCDIS